MRIYALLLQKGQIADVVAAVKAMSEEKMRKTLAWRTVQARDETGMTTLPERSEAVDLAADLIVEGKVLRGILTLQRRRELIENEEALKEEEAAVDLEVAVEEVVVVSVRVVVVVVVVVLAGSESSKEEVAAIARKFVWLFRVTFRSEKGMH